MTSALGVPVHRIDNVINFSKNVKIRGYIQDDYSNILNLTKYEIISYMFLHTNTNLQLILV